MGLSTATGPWITRGGTVAGAAWTTSLMSCEKPGATRTSQCPPPRTRPRRARSTASITQRGVRERCKSHDRGIDIGTAPQPAESLLLIQGPLCPWLPRGHWRPRIENGCVQQGQPPTSVAFGPVAACTGSGAFAPGLGVRQASHARGHRGQPAGAAWGCDGPVSSLSSAAARGQRQLSPPLRDRPRDVQPGEGRGGGLGRNRLGGTGLCSASAAL